MRTARSLPYGADLCPGGSLSVGGVPVRETPSPCGQTDACENITCPKVHFAGGNNTSRSKLVFLILNTSLMRHI